MPHAAWVAPPLNAVRWAQVPIAYVLRVQCFFYVVKHDYARCGDAIERKIGQVHTMYVANVCFFDADAGGRYQPPESGYHPQLAVGDSFTSCRITHVGDKHRFTFNTEHRVEVTLLFPDRYAKHLVVGFELHFYEGSKYVGYGRIIAVLHADGGKTLAVADT